MSEVACNVVDVDVTEESTMSAGSAAQTPILVGDQATQQAKVVYARLPDAAKMLAPVTADVEQNGILIPSVVTVPTVASSDTSQTPTRRSVRQAQRKKRKHHGFVPKITINPIVPSKSEGTSSSSNICVKYVGNNHRQSHKAVDFAAKHAHLSSKLAGGEGPRPRKKTLREMLTGVPGFSMKPRKRTNKKLSHAAQIAQTMEGCIDLETPDSILVNTNLKGLLTKHNFSLLPANYQYKLITLLPECDRITGSKDNALRLSSTALNNEFFAKACTEWRERLSDGEFTPDNQQRLKLEEEREQIELDPLKAQHFEPVWGQKTITDVPKADSIHKDTDLPVVSASTSVRTSPVKKPTLVSTMLKQRSISQTVKRYGSVSAHPKAVAAHVDSGLLMKLPADHVGTMSQPAKRQVCQASDPPKRQKVVVTSKKVQAQTLAQIQAETQVVRIQKSQNNEIGKVSNLPTVIPEMLTSSPSQDHMKKPLVVNVSSQVTGSGLRSPTRTLAQIKSQTQAAKAKAQGQTRTLAQIKAETKARVHHNVQQEAQAKLHAHLLAKARGQSPTASIVKQVQSIIIPSQARQKQVKVTEAQTTADGVNLKRSLEICEQAKICMSQKNTKPAAPTIAMVQKPANQSTMKATTDNIDFKNYLSANIAQAHKTVSQILQEKSLAEQKLILQDKSLAEQQKLHAQVLAAVRARTPQPPSRSATPTKQTGAAAPVINISSTSVNTVPTTINVPSATASNVSIVVLPPPSVSQLTGITPAVFNVPSTRYMISSTAAAAQQNLLQQLIRSAAGSISVSHTNILSPQRAASAPPQQKAVQRVNVPVSSIIRSASVGTNAESLQDMEDKVKVVNTSTSKPQRTGSPNDIILTMSPDKVSFLGKRGTNGSKSTSHHVILTSASNVVMSSPGLNGSSAQTVSVVDRPGKASNQVVHQSNGKVIIISPEKTSRDTSTVQIPKTDGQTSQSHCACNTKGMKTCTKCGAFCHEDCISASKLCVTCMQPTT